jgi:hypothetical protein
MHSNIEQTRKIKTRSYTITISKTENVSNNQLVYEGLSKTNLPPFCTLIADYQSCIDYENITMAVSSLSYLIINL